MPDAEVLGVKPPVQVAVPVLVPLLADGTKANVQVYTFVTDPEAGTETPVPLVTTQAPPESLSTSVISAVMASQSLGLVTVMSPLTVQPLVVTFTV